ncbi:hypothetical protein C8R45DRAFT_1222854 [Mycena sanguinolenta]|nr:hypothetical protein C8R45DRAFT_1222854 [Mycena sanguinolenta]
MLSPLRRMPTETLGDIFSSTLPSTYNVFSTDNSPWVLTHVCGRWRAVKQFYPLEMVKIQIERARSLKILFIGSQKHDSIPQIVLLNLLAEHSTQLEELGIQLISHLVSHVTPLHRSFTSLRSAWVQWDTVVSQPSKLDSVDFFRMAVSLIDIGVSCDYRFVPTRLPISLLATISMLHGKHTASSSNRCRSFKRFVSAANLTSKTGLTPFVLPNLTSSTLYWHP